ARAGQRPCANYSASSAAVEQLPNSYPPARPTRTTVSARGERGREAPFLAAEHLLKQVGGRARCRRRPPELRPTVRETLVATRASPRVGLACPFEPTDELHLQRLSGSDPPCQSAVDYRSGESDAGQREAGKERVRIDPRRVRQRHEQALFARRLP